MDSLVYLIFGMAAVTYLPRLIPFLILADRKIPRRVDAFLTCIPVAALGALIIPGVFDAVPDKPVAGLAGILFTLGIGLWRGGIILPVLGAVAIAYLVLYF